MAPPNQPAGASQAQGNHEPNQPYFPGMAPYPNQRLATDSMDMSKVRELSRPTEHDYRPGHFSCPFFFSSLGDKCFESFFDLHSWDYHNRREAQMILPYLWMGPYTAAQNDAFLRHEGITMLLAVRDSHPAFRIISGDKAAQRLGLISEHVEIENYAALTPLMTAIIRSINNHVCQCSHHGAGPKKVLVFCQTGNEKSLLVVLGYLMAMLNMDVSTALSNVQARRLCVDVSEDQIKMLNTFESMLVAQRDIVTAERTLKPQAVFDPNFQPTARKRQAREMGHFEPNTQHPAVQASMQATGQAGAPVSVNPYVADDSGEQRQAVPPFRDAGSP